MRRTINPCGLGYLVYLCAAICSASLSFAQTQNDRIFYGYITVYGDVFAEYLYGDGSNITNVQPSSISGILSAGQLPATIVYNNQASATIGGVTLSNSVVTGNLVGNITSSGTSTFNSIGSVNLASANGAIGTMIVSNIDILSSITYPGGGGGSGNNVVALTLTSINLTVAKETAAQLSMAGSVGWGLVNYNGSLSLLITNSVANTVVVEPIMYSNSTTIYP